MNSFGVKIGFPDEWIDYSSLRIEPGAPWFAMVLAANRFDHARCMARIDAPVDRKRWLMAPQVVNAYYHPLINEIVFPAAILQPPFFDAAADDAVNFGAMGAVVGHEMVSMLVPASLPCTATDLQRNGRRTASTIRVASSTTSAIWSAGGRMRTLRSSCAAPRCRLRRLPLLWCTRRRHVRPQRDRSA